ncbi:MAG: PEGA domain-containing protein [Spirochaetaceae bacterium]|nr:PEGA domain-containing protein [Spirochaetaceae bacterium]
MNTLFRLRIFILGLGLLLPALSAYGDSFQQLEGTGLALASDPPGASVYLNGIKEGITPLTLPSLPPASYAIRLSKEGYFDRELTVTIPREGRLSVSLDLEKAVGTLVLRITSSSPDPVDPLIYVDGVLMQGSVLTLDEGSHSLRIRAFGWEDVSAVVYVKGRETWGFDALLAPARFGIASLRAERRRFNPDNPGSLGTTTVSFEVSAPGRGTFLVLNSAGQTLVQKELGPFTSWSQSISWDGRDQRGNILPNGNYTLKIEAAALTGDQTASAGLEAALDSSIYIAPSQTSAAVSGLSWAPAAELKAPLSWQLEGNLLFGKAPGEEAWRSLPFAVSFGMSLFERLEIGAAVNMTPRFEGKAPLFAGLSLKLGILKAGGWTGAAPLPLNLALGLRYGFSNDTELSPFGLPAGPELFLPFSVELNRLFAPGASRSSGAAKTGVSPRFNLLLVPALWWPAKDGLPGKPRGVVSGGLVFRRSPFSAALSVRTESSFDASPFQRVMTGGEIKFFPSLVVFSLSGGAWFESSRRGFYGGIGIGVIN